ncbi:MAG: TIGR03643 family protein [Rhizobacter sp.]|nr:TIGR03643 family protein [Ferruginibacter sp.]
MADLNLVETDRIIEMAWEDRTTFESIEKQFGLTEKDVIKLMRKNLKQSSFKMWRMRTNGRATKHEQLRTEKVSRFKCSRQRTISLNKINRR